MKKNNIGAAELLRDELRTAKQKLYIRIALIGAAVFVVCLALGLINLPFVLAYLSLIGLVGGVIMAAVFALMSYFEGRVLRATMRRMKGLEQEACAEFHSAKVLCGGPIRLSEKYLFAVGMGVCAPLNAITEVSRRTSSGKDQDAHCEMWLTLKGEKKPVRVMREEVGYVNRGLCAKAASYMQRVVENGGILPASPAQSAGKETARASRATAKELRALIASLTAEGLAQDRAYSLWLRDKNKPEDGGASIMRGKDSRMLLTGELEGIADAAESVENGCILSRDKTAAIVRERTDLSFVLEESQENGRIKVYRLTLEQFLQLDKYLYETGRYGVSEK